MGKLKKIALFGLAQKTPVSREHFPTRMVPLKFWDLKLSPLKPPNKSNKTGFSWILGSNFFWGPRSKFLEIHTYIDSKSFRQIY